MLFAENLLKDSLFVVIMKIYFFINIIHNSAIFFLVRKFYTLRCISESIYVDMRCFGVSWVFSKQKIPLSMDKSQKCHFNI